MAQDDRDQPIKLRFKGMPILARVKGVSGKHGHHFYELSWLGSEAIVAALLTGILLLTARFTVLSFSVVLSIAAQLSGTLLLVFGHVALISLLIARRPTSAMIEKVFAKRMNQGRCKACAFSLAGLNPEPDGCTLCPECGAAWRLPSADAADPDTRTLA
jgi:hypothetical protein